MPSQLPQLQSSREVFLRELVSNASDALDKLRFEQARSTDIKDPDLELSIAITTNKNKKTLTIADTGIGMTREELIRNIGTIAHSGSAEFIRQAMADKKNSSNIIGRFGIGFYSVFMAADKVILWKEIRVGVIIGVILSIFNYLRIYFVDGIHAPGIALTVCMSMIFIVIFAKVIGSMVPIIVKKMNLDPALIANPAISSVSDAVALSIYFAMATVFLNI